LKGCRPFCDHQAVTNKLVLDLKNLDKLTSKQRGIVRKSLKKRGLDLKRRMKANAHKFSGALRTSIADKVFVAKEGAGVVVGVRSRYSKSWKGKEKVPNRYGLTQEEANRFISRSASSEDVEAIRKEIQAEIDSLLK